MTTKRTRRDGLLALATHAVLALSLAVPLLTGGAQPAKEEKVRLRFVNADIESVVRAVAHFTGKLIVVDPRLKGTLTLTSDKPMTSAQALAALRSALRVQGIAVVESDGVWRVVPEADAKVQPGPVLSRPTRPSAGDHIITQVFQLKYESAPNLLPVLRPLVTASNPISAYAGNNTIVVTDYAGNVRRVAEIIASVDTPSAGATEVIRLQHAIASDIAVLLGRLLDAGGAQGGDPSQRVSVQAEPSSNSLVLRAPSPARAEQVKGLVARLDQPLSQATGNVHVVPLRNAEAAALARTLAGLAPADSGAAPDYSSSFSGAQQQRAPGMAMLASTQTPARPAEGPMPVAMGGLQGQAMVLADTATNSLIITAPQQIYRQLRAVIDKLDLRRAQVFVECLIAEVTSDQAAEFGIQWQVGLDDIAGSSTNVVGGTNFGGVTQNITSAAQNLSLLGPGLNVGVVKGTITIPGVGEITNLTALARALETVTKANILSTPTLLTLDNEEAQILVGQNVPLVTGQYVTPGTGGPVTVNPFQTIERQDVGLTLRVRPQISEGGTIKLVIYQEVSSLQRRTVDTADIVLNKRTVETKALVDDGSIVVLAGLVEDNVTSTREKVPLLGDLPLIGALFRYDTKQQVKTNLMVFIRPVVVRDEAASRLLAADRYDYMRNLQQVTPLPERGPLPDVRGPVLPQLDGSGRPAPAPSPPRTSSPRPGPAAYTPPPGRR
ncbi:MAG TPA: type II secretion system secretin GspD [Burkholderiales bacterium]|nr:type II secretion system secretin GspD [Burkholderiales bacterium]